MVLHSSGAVVYVLLTQELIMKKSVIASCFTNSAAGFLKEKLKLLRLPDQSNCLQNLNKNLLLLIDGSYKNIGEYVKTMKKITEELTLIDSCEVSPDLINLSCHLFFFCSPQHPCKEVLISILQALIREEVLDQYINDWLYSFDIDCVNLQLKHSSILQTLEVCCKKFSIEESVIDVLATNILQNVTQSIKNQREMLDQSPHLSTETLVSLSYSIGDEMQCAVSIIRKKLITGATTCTSQDDNYMNGRVDKKKLILQKLFDECLLVLKQDRLESDCWYITSLLLSYLLRSLLPFEDYYNEVQRQFGKSPTEDSKKNLWRETLNDVTLVTLCCGFLVTESSLDDHDVVVTDKDCVSLLPSNKQDDDNSNTSRWELRLLHLQVVYDTLLMVHARTTSAAGQIALSKCLAQWARAANCLVKNASCAESDWYNIAIQWLVAYVTTNLDHPIDLIRHQARDAFVEILKIGKLLYPKAPTFAEQQMMNVLKWDWHKRSVFVALQCMLDYISVQRLLASDQQLQEKLLTACCNQSLAPNASQLYIQLTQKHDKTMGVDSISSMSVWLVPALRKLVDCDVNKARLLLDYCLGKLLKYYGHSAVAFAVNWLENSRQTEGSESKKLNVLIMFLRIAQRFGLLVNKAKSNEKKATGGSRKEDIDLRTISSALVHWSDQIRLDGFALICESWKSTALVSRDDVTMLKYALPHNMTNQCPAYRQQLLNTLKKLFDRMHANQLTLNKPTCKIGGKEETLMFYDEFMNWITSFIFIQFFRGSCYPRRNLALQLLHHLLITFKVNAGHHGVSVSLFTKERIEILMEFLKDTFDENRLLALEILTHIDLKDHVKMTLGDVYFANLQHISLGQARDSCKPDAIRDCAYNLRLVARMSHDVDDTLSKLCRQLVSGLSEDIDLAKADLRRVAYCGTMHGPLYCLQLLLKDADVSLPSSRELWRTLLEECCECCARVFSVVVPVIGSDSPEGFLPEVEIKQDGDVETSFLSAVQSCGYDANKDMNESTGSVAQKILVACWRSAKESSLLLQLIASLFPLDSSPESRDGVLSWKQLLEIGDNFRHQLMETRHRGAFEVAYSAFKEYCPLLWRSKHEALNLKPREWVTSTISSIADPLKAKTLCTTRRSAGLPFFLQAVLGSDKGKASRDCLHSVMSTLLSLVDCNVINSMHNEDDATSQVHALNILRGLVKDASLGEDMLQYVSRCLMVALTGFKSRLWSIRNSSTLLFSALIGRIFGAKREKDLETSGKNRLSSHEFTTRMPGLLDFLKAHLENSLPAVGCDDDIGRQSSLYPALLLLSRVYPSTTRHSSLIDPLASFPALVIRCGHSSIFKCRVMASIALSSMVASQNSLHLLSHLVRSLTSSKSHNETHGTLLQVLKLLKIKLKETTNQSPDAIECFSDVTMTLCDHIALGTRLNTCYVTRAAFIDLSVEVASIQRDLSSENVKKKSFPFINDLIGSLINDAEDQRRANGFNITLPGHTMLWESIGRLLAYSYLWGMSSNLTSNPYEVTDVILTSLRILKKNFKSNVESNVEFQHLKRDSNSSHDLESYLISIVTSQRDRRCLVKAYQLLAVVAGSRRNEVLVYSRQLADQLLRRDEKLFGAVVLCQAACLASIFETNGTKVSADVLLWLPCWIQLLTDSTSILRNDVYVRRKVANAVRMVAAPLLIDFKRDLGGITVDAWTILLVLLIDDNSGVRQIACNIVHLVALQCKRTEADHPLVDSLSLEVAIRLFVDLHGTNHPERSLAVLDHVIRLTDVDCRMNLTDGGASEATLFAPGSWNSFLEQFLLKRVITEARVRIRDSSQS